MPTKLELIRDKNVLSQLLAAARQQIADLQSQLAEAKCGGEQLREEVAKAKMLGAAEELSFLLNKHLVQVQYDNGYRIAAVPQAAIVDRAAELRKELP